MLAPFLEGALFLEDTKGIKETHHLRPLSSLQFYILPELLPDIKLVIKAHLADDLNMQSSISSTSLFTGLARLLLDLWKCHICYLKESTQFCHIHLDQLLKRQVLLCLIHFHLSKQFLDKLIRNECLFVRMIVSLQRCWWC